MKEERYHLVLDDFEQGVVIRALNDLRTDLISDKRETDAVDEVLLKVCKAPTKKIKVVKQNEESRNYRFRSFCCTVDIYGTENCTVYVKRVNINS